MKKKFAYSIIAAWLIVIGITSAAHSQGKIAFDSCAGGNCEIFLINPDGTGEVRLTFNTANDNDPSLSANGRRIAFTTTRDGEFQQIYVMNADGTNQTRVTNNSEYNYSPAISPDGSMIAYSSERHGDGGLRNRIYLINSDGSNEREVIIPGSSFSPAFSRDGRRIVFSSFRNGDSEIYVMNVDGSGQVRLTNAGGPDLAPSFSPLGDKIYFTSFRRRRS